MSFQFIVKLHKRNTNTIMALCDKGLLGKTFEEGKAILDLSSTFYKGLEASEEEVSKLLHSVQVINVAGEIAINFCINEKVLSKASVKKIDGVPYAQIVNEL